MAAYLILFFLFLLWLFLFLYYFFLLFSLFKTKVPSVSTLNQYFEDLKKLDLKQGSLVDLGCANGKALRFFEKEFGLKTTGYDINCFEIFLGKLINLLAGFNSTLYCKDFFKASLKDYDYIYLYLVPSVIEKIENWIFENKQKNAIVISTAFPFKSHKPFKKIGNIYLYK